MAVLFDDDAMMIDDDVLNCDCGVFLKMSVMMMYKLKVPFTGSSSKSLL
jgi:hypothetical protein